MTGRQKQPEVRETLKGKMLSSKCSPLGGEMKGDRMADLLRQVVLNVRALTDEALSPMVSPKQPEG